MKIFLRILLIGLFLNIGSAAGAAVVYFDTYPKNPKIDVINYVFKIELSDTTDEIVAEATVDVRFLADGVGEFRLDLTNTSTALNGKGMSVSRIMRNGKAVEYRHDNNALIIKLSTAATANQRDKFTIFYKGIKRYRPQDREQQIRRPHFLQR